MKMYHAPQVKVFGTVEQLTQGIKDIKEPSDGNYLGTQPLNGSCHCVCPPTNDIR